MGTKNKPGKYDGYAKAEPDEPMFVLLARDPLAPMLVRLWADLREQSAGNPSQVFEARTCAITMETWRVTHKERRGRAECGAHAYAPDNRGVCEGCGRVGVDSHWGHRAGPVTRHDRTPDTPYTRLKGAIPAEESDEVFTAAVAELCGARPVKPLQDEVRAWAQEAEMEAARLIRAGVPPYEAVATAGSTVARRRLAETQHTEPERTEPA